MKRVLIISFAIAVLPLAALAQQQIVEPGPQHFPVINFQGNIAYRSSGASTHPHALLWRKDPSAAPEFLDGSGPAQGLPWWRERVDGHFFAMTSQGAYYQEFLKDVSGVNVSLGLLSYGRGVELPPGASSPIRLPTAFFQTASRRARSIAAAPWGSRWNEVNLAWSEYVMGGWDVVFSRDDHTWVFDLGGDDIEPTVVDAGSTTFVGWTSKRNERAILDGRYGIAVYTVDWFAQPVFEEINARHPSLAKDEWGNDPALVFEVMDTGGSHLEYVLFDVSGSVLHRDLVETNCRSASRPVASWDGSDLFVLYTCFDTGTGTLHIASPRRCDVQIDYLDHVPFEHEQAQYDIAGEHIVYSRYVGPDPGDFDLFYTSVYRYC